LTYGLLARFAAPCALLATVVAIGAVGSSAATAADTQPPSVWLNGPVPGATVSGVVSAWASAADDVGLASVDLWVDGRLVASDAMFPFAWAWNSASIPDGQHSLQARARDTSGNVGTSSTVSVTVANNVSTGDTQAPSVTLGAPLNGAVVSSAVSAWASASDNVGVSRVDLLVDGKVVGSDSTYPYAWGWSSGSVADGGHSLQARAYDAAGNAGTSGSVSITVANNAIPVGDTSAPSVSLGAPGSGATVSGSVSVWASASDNVGVAKVDLLVDGSVVGTDSTYPYAWGWSSTSVGDGGHTLQARAYDAVGNVGSSSPVSVTVANNQAAAPSPPAPAPAPSCSGVSVSPGQGLQSLVNSYGSGTTFCLRAGLYRLTSGVVPKAGDQFIGEPGTVVSGAKDITGLFSASGGVWVASGQTQRNTASSGQCEAGFPLCAAADDVFFDNRLLQRVGSVGEVGPGRFFFDYGAQRIYIGDNPSGHLVEAAVATRAFTGAQSSATGVTIRGIVVEKFANEASTGAIAANSGWAIENNEVRLNHGIGIQGGVSVRNNYVHDNGQLGLSLYGESDQLVEGNEIAYNDTAGYATQWEAGGAKFMRTTRLTVRNNYVHDNRGIGFYTDSDNINVLYDNNRIDDNSGTGILIETGYQTVIRNNTIRRNGFGFTGGLTGAGIYLNTSQDVEIYGNTVDRNLQGIAIATFGRGSGPYGAYATKNDYVHDNTVILVANGGHGIASDNLADYTSNNNRFQSNHYTLCGAAYFAVSNGGSGYRYTNQQGWTAAGYDTDGTFANGC
jgi:parallel beta-helix repeat protein